MKLTKLQNRNPKLSGLSVGIIEVTLKGDESKGFEFQTIEELTTYPELLSIFDKQFNELVDLILMHRNEGTSKYKKETFKKMLEVVR